VQRLEESGGVITKAAASLGIERSNLYRKMKAYGIRAEAGEGEVEGE
jgi:transcriptional regulator of acetoin/glycerol metabolism